MAFELSGWFGWEGKNDRNVDSCVAFAVFVRIKGCHLYCQWKFGCAFVFFNTGVTLSPLSDRS